MGHRKAGQQENDKEFYHRQPSLNNIVGAYQDKHRLMRRALSAAFSAQAMTNQQPLIQTYINLFIQRMHENAAAGKTLNMVHWFNWTTFDIIGDLAFGEPFGCLEKSESHFWITQLFDSIFFQSTATELSRYPIIGKVLPKVIPRKFAEAKIARATFAAGKVQARIDRGDRPDLIGAMLKKKEVSIPSHGSQDPRTCSLEQIVELIKLQRGCIQSFTDAELRGNADALIVAGSETTATTLAAAAVRQTMPILKPKQLYYGT